MNPSTRTSLAVAFCGIMFAVVSLSREVHAQTLNADAMRERPVPVEDEVKKQLEESRWGLGPIRFDPYLELGSIGYNNNVFGQIESNAVSDLTASVSGGLNFVAPLGARTYLRGAGGASYIWYLEQTGLRRLAPTASLEVLALWNRLRLQVGADIQQANVITTSEAAAAIPQETRNLTGTVSIEVLRRLSLVGGYRKSRILLDAEVDPANYASLDRDETVLRGGLEYGFRSYMSLGVAAEKAETRFTDYSTNSDFDATNYLVTARYDQKRFFLSLEAGTSDVETLGTGSNAGVTEQTPIYGAFLSYIPGTRTELRVFTSKRVQPSLSAAADFLVESRTGAGIGFRLGNRTTLDASGEFGRNSYPASRSDIGPDQDVTKATAGLHFKVWRKAIIGFTVRWENYTSDDPRFDRRIVSGNISASF